MSDTYAARGSAKSRVGARCRGLLFAASIGLGSRGAFAQGAPPTVSQLLIDPTDERHLALRSNFGLLVSRDAGATWDWRAKSSMGYQGRAEPAVAILNGGALALGVSTGVVTGDAAGCDFKPASGIDANVVDIAAIPETRGAALAVSVSFADSASRVWISHDGGRSFQLLGAVIPHFTALSLGVPAGVPKRVYMTGLLWAAAVVGAFAVSDDAGKHFTITSLPNSDSGSQPFVAGVDPKRPDTIYLRFTGIPGRLRVSDDAGRTFREVLSIPGQLQGFAITPSGDQAFASSLEAGTYRADTGSLKFEQVACGGLPCLAATGTALLGCGERTRDGFVVGRSVDSGRSFSVLLDTPCIVPARCGAGTSVGRASAEDWPRVSALLGQGGTTCDRAAPSKPFSHACFSDGGNGSGAAPGNATPGPTLPVAAAKRDSGSGQRSTRGRAVGCGCVLSRGRTRSADFWLSIGALLLAACALGSRRALLRARALANGDWCAGASR